MADQYGTNMGTMACGHDEHWLAYRNPVDYHSERYCVFCEVERLREENNQLRAICMRRFISCLCSGDFDEDTRIMTTTKWHWSCGLCGAESFSETDQENLDHKADCPLKWLKETP